MSVVICLASRRQVGRGRSLSVRLLDRITFRRLSRVAIALAYALRVCARASLSTLHWLPSKLVARLVLVMLAPLQHRIMPAAMRTLVGYISHARASVFEQKRPGNVLTHRVPRFFFLNRGFTGDRC
jgi:hypothetical protein